MRHARWAVSLVIAATVLAALPARAQDYYEARRVHVSPYVGIFLFDDEQLTDLAGVEVNTGVLLGARAGFAITRSWEVEAGYGYSGMETEPSEFDEPDDPDLVADLDAHLVYGAIVYKLAYHENPTELLLTAGLGALILDPEAGDSITDPVLELGAGFTHPIRTWITVRGEARDHMTFCSGPDAIGDSSACPGGDELLHHIEVSAGLQFWLF